MNSKLSIVDDIGSPRSSSTRILAQSPFDDNAADVVLRSSDNVDFFVYGLVLSLASPFFKSMFSLKQPSTAQGDSKSGVPSGDPIIMSEDSATLDHLLRFCYPIRDPIISDLAILKKVLEAAIKYDVDDAIYVLRQLILAQISSSALQVYAIFCELELADDALVAAETYRGQQWSWLGHCSDWLSCNEWWTSWDSSSFSSFAYTLPGRVYDSVIDNLSAGSYFRLLQYLRTGDVCKLGQSTIDSQPVTKIPRHNAVFPDLSQSGADVVLKATDGRSFSCHTLVLNLASAQRLLVQEKDSKPEPSPRVHEIDLDGDTLNDLLIACYPPLAASIDLDNYGDARPVSLHVLPAAHRLKISSILSLAKLHWSHYVAEDPLSAYCIAIRLGWDLQAQQAARGALNTDRDIIHQYTADMERISAQAYQRLLKYHYHCYHAAVEKAYEISPQSKSYTRLSGLREKPTALSATSTILLPVAEMLCIDKHKELVSMNIKYKERLEQAWAHIKLDA